jgi:Xaa-Pro aminopeptidase
MNRIEKVRAAMESEMIDGLLVTDLYNLRYVANFTGTTGAAVITRDKCFFITDSRYTEQATEQANGFEIVQNVGPIFEEVQKIVEQEELVVLGFEDSLSYREYLFLEEMIPADIDLESTTDLIMNVREIKEPEEIETIKKACEITDKAFTHILDFIKPGVTELEVANELDFTMRSLGATSVSFDTIVASGVRSAMPHGVATDKKIQAGELVTLDFGCYYNGYVSDMTRTIAVGEVDDKLKEIYQIVLDAQLKVLAAAKNGLTGAEFDKIARDYITEKGYGPNFGHGIGHGIGLEIHEGPAISQRLDNVLQTGQVVTDEPGIYIEGLGGVRIEDDLLITEDGCVVLNSSPKELIVLDF